MQGGIRSVDGRMSASTHIPTSWRVLRMSWFHMDPKTAISDS
jgi:hypothetical protein